TGFTARHAANSAQLLAGLRRRADRAGTDHVALEPGPQAHPGAARRGFAGHGAAGRPAAGYTARHAEAAGKCFAFLAPGHRSVAAPAAGGGRAVIGFWPDPAGHGPDRAAAG